MQTLSNLSSCSKSTKGDFGVISVFITNLGKYNEGELVGEWLTLPTNSEQVNLCLKRIEIDGYNYEEFFFTDYESTINGVSDHISEYSNLNELNYLACKLEELSNDDIEIYEAAIELGCHVQSVADLIHLVDNLDCFELLPDIHDEYDLGYYWIEESGCYNLKELGNLVNYFDYEKYDRDVALEQSGTFCSSGYIYDIGESFTEDYDGKDVPEKYCVLTS
ncbi:antirestriction protein ArdA [Gilliamella sp. Pas-s27]|uniref:antirestriction protein ArdA n=1 Tax=Gilliamella sp. Pas-s27 TaxID=2687311 RepID=UPI001365F85C|nr:antirestriction protein ArdA [Gilliamella sp. Pas-s27]MWP46309.1 antirestriction protein ArdA [Gilliamella sp. Pas-s27]